MHLQKPFKGVWNLMFLGRESLLSVKIWMEGTLVSCIKKKKKKKKKKKSLFLRDYTEPNRNRLLFSPADIDISVARLYFGYYSLLLLYIIYVFIYLFVYLFIYLFINLCMYALID